jgi:hypothetical protein
MTTSPMNFINSTPIMEFINKTLIRLAGLVCISLSVYLIWFDFLHLLFSPNHAFHIRLFRYTLPVVAFSAAFFGWSALREGKFSGTAAMFFLQNYKITSGNSK